MAGVEPRGGVSFSTLQEALSWVRGTAGAGGSSARAAITPAGLEEGLRSTAVKAPIRWPDDLPDDDASDEQRRRAAVLAGHLLRYRLAEGEVVSEPVLLADIGYAAALATPQGQRCLGELTEEHLLKAHGYACILGERQGHTIDREEELRLFAWLLAQADLEPDQALLERMLRLRTRRQAHLA